MKKIFYGKQSISKTDISVVSESLLSKNISSGPYVNYFELKISKYLNTKHPLVCSSGTAALHLAFLSLGLKKGDTVIMPSVNFISSYNVAKLLDLNVYLSDVDLLSGQITKENIIKCIKINRLKKIHALVIMYHAGYPENINEIYELKKKYNFFIIEDACHAFGAKYKISKKVFKVGSCSHSDISTFSFHPLKTITTGEGGLITFKRKIHFVKAKLLRSHGLKKNIKYYWKYKLHLNGLNYRISDINCALGISQLKRSDIFIKKRLYASNYYSKLLSMLKYYVKRPNYKCYRPANHLYLISINFDLLIKNKDDLINYLNCSVF